MSITFIWRLYFVMLCCLASVTCQSQPKNQTNNQVENPYYHSIKENEYFTEIWVSEGFISCLSCIQTYDGDAIILGNLSGNNDVNLLRVDIATKAIKWIKPADGYGPIWVGDTTIYTSSNGTTRVYQETQTIGTAVVTAHNASTGEAIWSNSVYGARSLPFLSASDTIVSAAGQEYINLTHLDVNTGARVGLNDDISPIIYLDDRITLTYRWNYGGGLLNAIETDSQKQLWQYNGDIGSFFVEKDILILGSTQNKGVGDVSAIDLMTGETKWTYDKVISNVAVSDSKVYFFQLAKDAEWSQNVAIPVLILVVDINSGERISTLNFIPEGIKPMYGVNSYNVWAYDDLVAVYFGDSHQFLAFQFAPPSSAVPPPTTHP